MACRLIGAKPLSEPMLEYCLFGPWGTNLLIFNRNSYIFIQENVFKNVVCETAAILSRPQCVKVKSFLLIWRSGRFHQRVPYLQISCRDLTHCDDVIMRAIASQITSLTIVYSTVYSRRRSKKTSKLRVTGLCAVNSPVTDEFTTQRASNAENVSIWWHHHMNMRG